MGTESGGGGGDVGDVSPQSRNKRGTSPRDYDMSLIRQTPSTRVTMLGASRARSGIPSVQIQQGFGTTKPEENDTLAGLLSWLVDGCLGY